MKINLLAARHIALLVAALTVIISGCAEDTGLIPVTGTVKYADGTIPAPPAEIYQTGYVHFSPANRVPNVKTSGPQPATGTINPEDGSFTLMTGKESGAMPGEYKVHFTIPKMYPPPRGMSKPPSVVADQYTSEETTPFTKTVSAENATFELVLEKE